MGTPVTRYVVLLIGVAAITAAIATSLFSIFHCYAGGEVYRQFHSPNNDWRVVVYRCRSLFAMPGQSSDAPGRVVLIDKEGNIVRQQPIEMVQLATPPVWETERVVMKLQFDWPLQE